MKDQPVPPLQNAVFWVEYVLRHRGAPHFKSSALELTWYQYYMVDAIVFVFAVAATSLFILYKTIRIVNRTIIKRKINSKKKIN